MGVDWSHNPETSINYHQVGPTKYVENGYPGRHKEDRSELEGA